MAVSITDQGKGLPPSRSARRAPWRRRLINTERGFSQSFRGESTLFSHCFAACVVLVTGAVVGITLVQWALVLLSLSVAVSAEMFHMVLRAVWSDLDQHLSKQTRKALQIGSAAVFVARCGACAAIGVIYAARIMTVLAG